MFLSAFAGGQSWSLMSVFCKCVFCLYSPQHAVASCGLFLENANYYWVFQGIEVSLSD